ncbi:hypothetical protein [Peribacillus butanolivorans]|uniref:hypothetical protein n=1 Tax=Peribacillus butanolivorans TaxID=421767 RepID=UPI0035D61BB4
MMMKRIFALIAGSLLSVMFLAGCGTNNNDNNPAPEDNNIIDKNGVDDNNVDDNNVDDNNVNDNNVDDNNLNDNNNK